MRPSKHPSPKQTNRPPTGRSIRMSAIAAALLAFFFSTGTEIKPGASDFENGEAIGRVIGSAVGVALVTSLAAYLLTLRSQNRKTRWIAFGIIFLAAVIGSTIGATL